MIEEEGTLKGRIVWMATGNREKYLEARNTLSELEIELRHLETQKIEIQADNLIDIATYSLEHLETNCRPTIVEDAGLFIDYFSGFPGPYSSYVLSTLGLASLLKLMKNVKNRRAFFQSAVAFKVDNETRCFSGIVQGIISHKIRGSCGFGYDPIFIPSEGDGRTFGEMSTQQKNLLSHRSRAFRSFGEWFISNE